MPQLPALGFDPRNALFDTSGISSAIDSNRTNALKQRESDREDQELTLRKNELSYNQGRQSKADAYENLQRAGAQAMAIDQMPDNHPAKAMAWNRYIKTHGDGNHSPEEMDFRTGPKLAAAMAGKYLDPRASQMTDLDLEVKRAQIAASKDLVAERGEPKFSPVGSNSMGQTQYGFVDPRAKQVTPYQPQATGPQASGAHPEAVSGEQYLAGLDPQVANQVKAISDGRMQVPGGFALKSPYWQQMMAHVSRYDPNFDAVNYQARASTRRDFSSGPSAKNITSFNTAIGHVDQMDQAVDGLGNTSMPMLNKVRNAVRAQGDTGYQQNLKTFQASKQAVVEELSRAFKGAAPDVHAVEGWENAINEADSPAALHAATRQIMGLLESRIQSLGDQYNRGMGTTKDPHELLNPHSRETMRRLQGGEQKIQGRLTKGTYDMGDGHTLEVH